MSFFVCLWWDVCLRLEFLWPSVSAKRESLLSLVPANVQEAHLAWLGEKGLALLAVSVQQERKSRGSQRKGRWCLDKSKASFHVIQKSR